MNLCDSLDEVYLGVKSKSVFQSHCDSYTKIGESELLYCTNNMFTISAMEFIVII